MTTEPVRVPVAVGLKVIGMAQLANGARLAPQLLVWAKSPLAAMLEIFRGALPSLIRTSVFTALVVPTLWEPKVMGLLGSRSAIAALPVPVPLSCASTGAPSGLS